MAREMRSPCYLLAFPHPAFGVVGWWTVKDRQGREEKNGLEEQKKKKNCYKLETAPIYMLLG